MGRLMVFLVAVISCHVPSILSGQDSENPKKIVKTPSAEFRRHDSFNDKMTLKWKRIREDKEHWSLKRNPGH